ncbi:MAG: NiFeSe hydrogenase maturation protease [Desulfoplanes sp.]
MKELLVLGVGNILLMDEGVGVYAVQELLKDACWPEDRVDFIDGGTFTQDIFYLFQEYEKLLVLDAVRGGRNPGTIYRHEERDLRENKKQALSLHDIDLLDSLKMAGLLGNKPKLTVLGIEPLELSTWKMELTPILQKTFPRYMDIVRHEVREMLHLPEEV